MLKAMILNRDILDHDLWSRKLIKSDCTFWFYPWSLYGWILNKVGPWGENIYSIIPDNDVSQTDRQIKILKESITANKFVSKFHRIYAKFLRGNFQFSNPFWFVMHVDVRNSVG